MLLRRHSFATTLGLIDAALFSTNLINESNFLQVKVNMAEHLPFAELQPLRVQVALLQKAKVQLDGRADIAVGPREDDLDAELLDRRSHFGRPVVRRVVEEHDSLVAPQRVLAVQDRAELVEEGNHDARVRVGSAEGYVGGPKVVNGRDEAGPWPQLLLGPHIVLAGRTPRVALERRRAQPALVDVDDAHAARQDLDHHHRVSHPAQDVPQPIRLRCDRLDLFEAEAELALHYRPQFCHRVVERILFAQRLAQPGQREHALFVLVPVIDQPPDRIGQLALAGLLLFAQRNEVVVLLGGSDHAPSQCGRDIVLGSNGAVTEEFDLLAVNDGANIGGAQLTKALPDLVDLRNRVVLSLALLVLLVGLAERVGDDCLADLCQVYWHFFVFFELGRSFQRVLSDIEHHLLESLHLVLAERILLALRANWRLLVCISVEERLRTVIIELLLVEQVRQCLLDIAMKLVHLDLLGRVNADPLDSSPDLVLVGLRAVKCAQLVLELRVELAIVVQLIVFARLLVRNSLVALA